MKKLALSAVSIYTSIISPAIHQLLGIKTACRYEVSCSRYAGLAIEKYGFLKGTVLSVRRIVTCQPFFNL